MITNIRVMYQESLAPYDRFVVGLLILMLGIAPTQGNANQWKEMLETQLSVLTLKNTQRQIVQWLVHDDDAY